MKSDKFLDTIEISALIPKTGKHITMQSIMDIIRRKYNGKVKNDPDLAGDVFKTMTPDQFERYLIKRYAIDD